MFYIISSRIPLISSDNTNRKYFKLFVTGSIFYVLIHYYLNKDVRFGLIEKFRKFIYHVMAVDLAIACILSKYIKTSKPKEKDEDGDNDSSSVNPNKKDQQGNNPAQLTHELEEQRRLFLEEHQRKLLHERMMEQRVMEQRMMEQRMMEQRAAEQKAAEQKKSKKSEKDSDSDKSEKSDKSSVSEKSEKSAKRETKKTKEVAKPSKPTKPVEVTDEANTESDLPIYN
jgi:hypothetical protein